MLLLFFLVFKFWSMLIPGFVYLSKKLDYHSCDLFLLLFHSYQVYSDNIKITWLFSNFILCVNIFSGCMLVVGSYPQYASWNKVGFYSFKSALSKEFFFYSIVMIYSQFLRAADDNFWNELSGL